MASSPEVTVLVATFNRAHCIAQALDSLLAQTLPPSQIIVIDDGSTDSTAEVLARYRDRIEILTQENGGKSSALNRAMPLATGEYVWIFDDDDVALSHALECHVGVLEAHPEVDFTYGTGYVVDAGDDGVHRRRRLKKLPEFEQDGERDETLARLLEFNFMPQQAVVARRRCYREVGPYDERLPVSHDYDMMLRLTRRFVYRRVEEPTFVYVQHHGLRGTADDRYGRSERELRWVQDDRKVVAKLYPELTLRECLPGGRHRGELSAADTRRALLQRMCFAVRRGLWTLAWDDLQAVCEVLPATPLSADERRLCVSSLDKYLGRYIAMDALMADREMSRRVAGLGRSNPGSHSVAREIRMEWARMFHRYGVAGPFSGHVPKTLLYAFRLDGGRAFASTVVEALRRKYAPAKKDN